MDFIDQQIAPPKSWDTFEELCLALFKQIWANPLAKRHGRSGQPQHGVDVYGTVDAAGAVFQGVQCKGKTANYDSKATVAELRKELAKADKFQPSLNRWIFATTSPSDDKLEAEARRQSVARIKRGKCAVDFLSWDDIQRLIADYSDVLKQFYPQHASNLPALIDQLRQIVESATVRTLTNVARDYTSTGNATDGGVTAAWLPVKFTPKRDLKPALMGRPLGPADAVSCPQLVEAKTLIEELKRGYFVRLVGETGAGKSICAFQAAHHFAAEGWRVVSLTDPSSLGVELEQNSKKTIHIIDDAHLMSPWALARVEAQANAESFLLTTHNAQEQSVVRPGVIMLDAKRAVRTIATNLRRNLPQTLKLVGEVDDQISDDLFDEDLDRRLENAELSAERPWQFCFILGGGWRRAKQAADNARAVHADIILAIAGMRQIASRDARCSASELKSVLAVINATVPDAEMAIRWLIDQRLLISAEDLRTPHQRFAAVAMLEIFNGQDDTGRASIWEAVRILLQDAGYPLAGLRSLLHEIHFGEQMRWNIRIEASWVDPLLNRCWNANSADLPIAVFLISQILNTVPSLRGTVEDRKALLVNWLSRPDAQTGYALHDLLHHLNNDDKPFLKALMADVNAKMAAVICSEPTPASAAHLGKYMQTARQFAAPKWRKSFKFNLSREPILRLAMTWPLHEPIWGLGEYCQGIYYNNSALGLDMLQRILPQLGERLNKEPAETFREFDDIFWHVLKGIDPLGIYARKHKQTKREMLICRRLCSLLDPSKIGHGLSSITKKQFQPATFLLDFVRRASPKKFTAIVAAIEWPKIDTTIGDHWARPFHDFETFLRIASRDKSAAKAIGRLIDSRTAGLAELPGRLGLLSHDRVVSQLRAGKSVMVGRSNHVDWPAATVLLARLIEQNPELVSEFLAPLETNIAQMLSRSHPSFWRDANVFFHLTRQFAPSSLDRIMSSVDASTAREHWTTGVLSPSDIKRPTSLLLDIARKRRDALGKMAKDIFQLYPRKSKPAVADLKPFTVKGKR